MSTAEWNNPSRITSLMSGTPNDPDKLTALLPEFKLSGKKCSLMVPKTKFFYTFQLFDKMPRFVYVPQGGMEIVHRLVLKAALCENACLDLELKKSNY